MTLQDAVQNWLKTAQASPPVLPVLEPGCMTSPDVSAKEEKRGPAGAGAPEDLGTAAEAEQAMIREPMAAAAPPALLPTEDETQPQPSPSEHLLPPPPAVTSVAAAHAAAKGKVRLEPLARPVMPSLASGKKAQPSALGGVGGVVKRNPNPLAKPSH